MSIVVEQLSKTYGTQKALNEVSFEAPQGKITGFLGPNGAGKSTTMKIAAGYIAASWGAIRLNGNRATTDSLTVKRITGYLPEHNPLYHEMYVKEYLTFIASAYSLKNIPRRVGEMVSLCGLAKEQKKQIRQLSKGYRQRVGLAQALIHDPEILILDEPTGGLDPNQLVEVRKVIKEASREKTVLLSSHIMQEVEALCDKVVIINKGEVVADDEVSQLKSQSKKVSYWVELECAIDTKVFQDAGFDVQADGVRYRISGKQDPRRQLMNIITERELPLVNIQKEEESLEQIFQNLTAE